MELVFCRHTSDGFFYLTAMLKAMQLIRKLKQHDIIPLWSNLPFYIPAGLAIQKGLLWYGLLIALATTVSLYYHHTDETALKKTDRVLAYSVVVANLYVLHLSGWKQPYFAIALIFVAIAFYFFFHGRGAKYDLYHGLWHLSSVVITMMCVLAY